MTGGPQESGDARPKPSFLAYSRAAFTVAKARRMWHWRLEAAASALALLSAFMPFATAAAVTALLSVGAKLLAKQKATQSRGLFRQAERARRYDFEQRTLGWPVPGRVHADALLACPGEVEELAGQLAKKDDDYFAEKGDPSASRFVWNLAESIFWQEKLSDAMVAVRGRQFVLALAAIGGTLCGLVLVQPSGLLQQAQVTVTVFVGLKVLGALVSLLVALDVYGELSAFRRGSRDSRDLLAALERSLAPPKREEALRILIEYNCLLADLPMVPDEVHAKHRARLNSLWADVSARLRSAT
jgi:hypothetical protein